MNFLKELVKASIAIHAAERGRVGAQAEVQVSVREAARLLREVIKRSDLDHEAAAYYDGIVPKEAPPTRKPHPRAVKPLGRGGRGEPD